MPDQTRTYAVTMTLCVGVAGDEANPIPTDHHELGKILAENFVDHINTIAEGGHWSEVADNIDSVSMVVENDGAVKHPHVVYPFSLPLENGDEDGEQNGFVEIGAYGIEVFLDGYGAKTENLGNGSVVFLNHWNGSPQLVVHGDILQESPTHIIQLETAEESRRDQDDVRSPLHSSVANPNLEGSYREVTHHFEPHKEEDGR